jgi:phage FluMu gp28-like protein
MRCGRRSIKSKNRDKKREGDADTKRKRERAVATCLESVAVIMEFEECD